MKKGNSIKLFENQKVRTQWNEQEEKWYFSVVDVLQILTESVDVSAYWRKLKQRLKTDLNDLSGLSKDELIDKRYDRLMSFGYC